ncbi:MAG: hypothetical protein KAJ19_24875, partial [Gammaproteobacteria bacterium]|nr:hypothetical protein [Gammaproteobacteria bacterium]
ASWLCQSFEWLVYSRRRRPRYQFRDPPRKPRTDRLAPEAGNGTLLRYFRFVVEPAVRFR